MSKTMNMLGNEKCKKFTKQKKVENMIQNDYIEKSKL